MEESLAISAATTTQYSLGMRYFAENIVAISAATTTQYSLGMRYFAENIVLFCEEKCHLRRKI